ncbi:MAG: membrane protein insertion efficiency factor YidD [Thermoleophilia bacterium]|nr:membrane protein insertion efficiency factor YidD [Thermoleophilia bacterium]
MRSVAIAAVRAYRVTVGQFTGGRCKYHPSCSQYAIDAIALHGVARGIVLAAWRLARCNPWSHGGVDRAEDQRLFRPSPRRARGSTA